VLSAHQTFTLRKNYACYVLEIKARAHVEYKDEYNIFRIKFRRLNKKIFAKNKVVCLVREKSTTVFIVTN